MSGSAHAHLFSQGGRPIRKTGLGNWELMDKVANRLNLPTERSVRVMATPTSLRGLLLTSPKSCPSPALLSTWPLISLSAPIPPPTVDRGVHETFSNLRTLTTYVKVKGIVSTLRQSQHIRENTHLRKFGLKWSSKSRGKKEQIRSHYLVHVCALHRPCFLHGH